MPSLPPDPAAHLAAIIQSADDAIISKDLDGVITSWNTAAERMFGWTSAEAVGRHISLIIPEDRLTEEDYVLGEVRAGRGVEHYETLRKRKDGTILDISLTVSPIRSVDGTVVGVSKIARDLSSRRRFERDALRLAAIVQSSDDAIVSKDLNGIIMTWNRGAQKIFGYTPEEAVGRSIRMIIPTERLSEEDEVLRRIRAGQSIENYETVRVRKDGTLVDISLTVSPIRDASGKIVAASKIARDVTEQRRLRETADEASRLKDEFLAVLSHELRTPLNTVLGYARMLQQHTAVADEPEQRRKALAVLARNADALAKLVNEVLDTSRVVTGKMQLSLGHVAVDALLREAVETIQPAAHAKQIGLSVAIAPGLTITGDADRLRQVAWNLLSNAVKFTPSGGHVTVRAVADGPSIRISVEDSGIGILPQDLPLVFQRFWQADRSVSREHAGLGIGLALARHIIELHGGHITATSGGRGAGATFTVDLPITQPPARREYLRQA